MRNLRANPRNLIVFLTILVFAQAGWAAEEWRRPLEPSYDPDLGIPIEPIRPAVDPCGCLRELRSCLISATLSLGRCLSQAPTPARQALCYLKFELDVLLCVERAGVCALTCVP